MSSISSTPTGASTHTPRAQSVNDPDLKLDEPESDDELDDDFDDEFDDEFDEDDEFDDDEGWEDEFDDEDEESLGLEDE